MTGPKILKITLQVSLYFDKLRYMMAVGNIEEYGENRNRWKRRLNYWDYMGGRGEGGAYGPYGEYGGDWRQ